MRTRESALKTVLWALMGVLAVLTLTRFINGLGATTALNEVAPWGFWIAFDIMCGVALAAGGFTLAATVYIFGLEKYRPFVRPAILTAFLGYAAVAVGLMYDLGLPWHIVNPVFYPQPHSVLFEVAMCVIIYLTVLLLEFAPVALEHPKLDKPILQKIHKVLKKATIPLVITGIVLSSLHQSSLGSLFLIAPHRVHPLWYSPIIWILFLVSAIGLGLMMVMAEAFFSAWLFGHKPRMDLLKGLGKAASVVLFLYAALRIGDLAVRGQIGLLADGSWQSFLFMFEVFLAAILPATLLAFPRVRQSRAGLFSCSAMTIFGVMGYRFNVCIVTFSRPEGTSYFPSWTEIAVTLGIVAGAMLIFIFFVKHLKVSGEEHHEVEPAWKKRAANPGGLIPLLPQSMSNIRRFSLAAITAAALALAFLPSDALTGAKPDKNPVMGVQILDGVVKKRVKGPGETLDLLRAGKVLPAGARKAQLYLIDGNRDRRMVLFNHKGHEQKLGQDKSCNTCHHQNLPFHKNSACSSCHRDMFVKTDIFNHQNHLDKLGGNKACVRCHTDKTRVKNRKTAAACVTCHKDMNVKGSRVKVPTGGLKGFAPGYMDAMHGLCQKCHQEKAKAAPQNFGKNFGRCDRCHQGVDGRLLKGMFPYAKEGK